MSRRSRPRTRPLPTFRTSFDAGWGKSITGLAWSTSRGRWRKERSARSSATPFCPRSKLAADTVLAGPFPTRTSPAPSSSTSAPARRTTERSSWRSSTCRRSSTTQTGRGCIACVTQPVTRRSKPRQLLLKEVQARARPPAPAPAPALAAELAPCREAALALPPAPPALLLAAELAWHPVDNGSRKPSSGCCKRTLCCTASLATAAFQPRRPTRSSASTRRSATQEPVLERPAGLRRSRGFSRTPPSRRHRRHRRHCRHPCS